MIGRVTLMKQVVPWLNQNLKELGITGRRPTDDRSDLFTLFLSICGGIVRDIIRVTYYGNLILTLAEARDVLGECLLG
ncbi:MAG: Uncharacterised protein [Gammaproteobacteria bacterium]|nr:MAG: Uncharacterised protein [Gammaproteobacteria bacterium]